MPASTRNPLADLLHLTDEEERNVFAKAGPEEELAPETRIVVLNFSTEAQRRKAADRILATGRIAVRIPGP